MIHKRVNSGELEETSGKVHYYDSSDEEDLRNTIGNIPIEWYDDFKHIGYDKDGNQIDSAEKKDGMEEFLDRMDDPNYWRKVYDQQSGGFVTLNDEEVRKLNALNASKYPSVGYNPYQPFLDIFSSQTEIHPISNRPDSKRSFIPSLDEKRIVGKMVHAIKMGWVRPSRPKEIKKKVYDLWADDPFKEKTKSELSRIRMHFPAPKVALPGHAESYNPPAEYLFDDEELKKWEEADPEDRRLDFVPKKYGCLRKVPAYDEFYNDRYQRCLDLYLAPRQRKMKLNVNHTELLPELPNLAEMRPFPTTQSFLMLGHSGQVRSLSFEPESAEIFASGGEDGTLRLWSICDGRCLKTTNLENPVTSVAYCPLAKWTLIAVTLESTNMILTNSYCGDRHRITATTEFLSKLRCESSENDILRWKYEGKGKISINLGYIARQVVWHHKGDYFATFANSKSPKLIYIHQLSSCKSQQPFSRLKGLMTALSFHPCEPLLFVGTQRYIRIYDLAKCQLKKKIMTGSQWVSSMHVDFRGDNLFVGGHDRIFSWIDLQLSSKPWKSVKHHTAAIRAVTQHARYPLIATVSDDSTAVVYYARISSDPFKENEFVPVRRLRTQTAQRNGLSILAAIFHPSQPWLITAHVDGSIALFT
uniref:Ribosome biogenesis protein BOP1 homolog n=1 Tax=Onchocerca volvulus TaxID=6282 RepID=A0A8R1XZF8_ONCVO